MQITKYHALGSSQDFLPIDSTRAHKGVVLSCQDSYFSYEMLLSHSLQAIGPEGLQRKKSLSFFPQTDKILKDETCT